MTLDIPSHQYNVEDIYGAAVYGWRRGDQYLYIGKSYKGITRLYHHHVIKPDKLLPGDKLDVWRLNLPINSPYSHSSLLLSILEDRLIKKYNPILNKHQAGGAGRNQLPDIQIKLL